MKRLFTLLLVVCACLCIPQKMMAEDLYLKGGYTEAEGSWTKTLMNNTEGSKYTLTFKSTESGKFCFRFTGDDWKGEICPYQSAYEFTESSEYGKAYYTDNNGMSGHYFYLNMSKGATYIFDVDRSNTANPSVTVTMSNTIEPEYEVVAEYGGKAFTRPLYPSRYRNLPTTDSNAGKYSTTLFTVGFKDEQLPGNIGDDVRVYIRKINDHSVQFRPSADGSSFGTNWTLANFTNLTGYCTGTYITGNNSNAIVIKKGSGVSYTVGLNLGGAISWTHSNGGYPISYGSPANSLTLYTNKSIDAAYADIFKNSGLTYKNTTAKKVEDLEDYYLLADWKNDGYHYLPSDGLADRKMAKQIFLNPSTNEVDSIVYSKIVRRSSAGFGKIYMSFAPQSLYDDTYNNRAWSITDNEADKLYKDKEKWNYVIRPEVQGQKDGTAPMGSVYIAGYHANDGNGRCNDGQSLNPFADETKGYYIVRLNVTTSTYRIEYVDDPEVTITTDGIRTFCNQLNLHIPDGYKAYVAHDFTGDKDAEYGQKQGTVVLRRLRYIPANVAVVLKADNVLTEDKHVKFPAITDADTDLDEVDQLTTVREKWWSHYTDKNYVNDTYNNYLVASLFGTTIENGITTRDKDGKLQYITRHFALNEYKNTKYFKDNNLAESENYWGFFRAKGTVPAGYAYLSLPSNVLTYDGQIFGNWDATTDENATNNSKFTFIFDDDLDDNTTGIKEVEAASSKTDDCYYNLQGMKVAQPTSGLYIHNGKKVIIK